MTSIGASPPSSEAGSCVKQDPASDRHLIIAGSYQSEEQHVVVIYTGGDYEKIG